QVEHPHGLEHGGPLENHQLEVLFPLAGELLVLLDLQDAVELLGTSRIVALVNGRAHGLRAIGVRGATRRRDATGYREHECDVTPRGSQSPSSRARLRTTEAGAHRPAQRT